LTIQIKALRWVGLELGGGWWGRVGGGLACGADLGGDVHGRHGVVLADAAGHEKGFDDAEDGGDAGPEEEEVENAEAVAAEIKVMDAEVAQEDGEEDAEELVFAGPPVFGVEPGALVVGHAGGIDGVGWKHIVPHSSIQNTRWDELRFH
jgi:hypothetical protein